MIGELRSNDPKQPMAEQMAQLKSLIGQKDSQLQVSLLRLLYTAGLWLLCACSKFLMLHKSQFKLYLLWLTSGSSIKVYSWQCCVNAFIPSHYTVCLKTPNFQFRSAFVLLLHCKFGISFVKHNSFHTSRLMLSVTHMNKLRVMFCLFYRLLGKN